MKRITVSVLFVPIAVSSSANTERSVTVSTMIAER
jgi:hypothetical protein